MKNNEIEDNTDFDKVIPYENKIKYDFDIIERKEDKDKYNIINKIQELSPEQKKSIILEGFYNDFDKSNSSERYTAPN